MASLLDEYSNIHQLVRVGRFQNEIGGKMCCANVFSFEKAEFSLLNCYRSDDISNCLVRDRKKSYVKMKVRSYNNSSSFSLSPSRQSLLFQHLTSQTKLQLIDVKSTKFIFISFFVFKN